MSLKSIVKNKLLKCLAKHKIEFLSEEGSK